VAEEFGDDDDVDARAQEVGRQGVRMRPWASRAAARSAAALSTLISTSRVSARNSYSYGEPPLS
jgi:hypothetical protein